MAAETSETCTPDAGFILSLQSQLHSLRSRIQELEAENKNLSSQLLRCSCFKKEKDEGYIGYADESSEMKIQSKKKTKCKSGVEKNPGYNVMTGSHHSKRYVALKVMYFGQRFYGFGSEAQTEPTVESEFFRALEKARLLIGDKKESFYSRCGRTDKGVSSIGQVVALFLRSNFKGSDSLNENCDQYFEEQYGHSFLNHFFVHSWKLLDRGKEIDYVKVINRVLPNDIRVLCWSPVPVGFSARFSCLSREYKYFFWKENLNISAMKSAGEKFLGEHDFRNFCKMDAANVHNYRRRILSFDICPCDARFEFSQLWAFKIKGTAFLWHQVRCMVAVLFMIGQEFESPDVIDLLLDTTRTPRKPQYTMASEIPLVLESCEFEGLDFRCSTAARQALCEHLNTERRSSELQVAMHQMALLNSFPLPNGDPSSLDAEITKKKVSHVRLLSRPTEPSYEERRAKFDSRSKSSSSMGFERA